MVDPPLGFADITQWLYLAASGPRLLGRIVNDCQKLLSNPQIATTNDESKHDQKSQSRPAANLTAGALILLKRHLDWLIDYLERNGSNRNVVEMT